MADNLYLCIKQFNSRLGDELNLKVGDKIEVLADDSEYNDGWYMGKNLSTGEAGLYPKSFTQLLINDGPPQPKLLRSRSRRLNNLNSPNSTIDDDNSRPNSVLSTPKQGFLSSMHHDSIISNNSNNHSQHDQEANNNNHNDMDVNKTMDDIDKALEELQVDTSSNSVRHSNFSITDLNPRDAITWNPAQVTSYFSLVLGFDTNVAGQFSRHKITGEILFQLDLSHLKELDIDSFGTRFEIFKEIENLKKSSASTSGGATRNNDTSESMGDDRIFKTPKQLQPPSQLPPEPSMERDSRGRDNLRGHSRQRSQSLDKLNTNFKFGDPLLDRPASSIYDSVNSMHSNSNSQSNFNSNQGINSYSHSRQPSNSMDYYHKRNSSVLSNHDYNNYHHRKNSSKFSWKEDKLISPAKLRKEAYGDNNQNNQNNYNSNNNNSNGKGNNKSNDNDNGNDDNDNNEAGNNDTSSGGEIPVDDIQLSPKKNSTSSPLVNLESPASSSPALSDSSKGNMSRFKTLKTASTNNFKNLTSSKKSKTSAFTEGIRNITPDEAIKTAHYSGFMAKRSGNNLSWRSRYFTLHGTRLSYFTSLKDKKEKGLIDITAHKVIPISTDGEDKYIALYASSTGLGRYCFKIVPPAPGFKKGLTFTQPKVHYFAVETADDMRGWMKALMTSTIDIDDSVPVVSSCATPTVSLAKAQELLAKAREETKLKDIDNDADFSEAQLTSFMGNYTLDPNSSGENSPLVETMEERNNSSSNISSNNNSGINDSIGPYSDRLQNSFGSFPTINGQRKSSGSQQQLNVNVNANNQGNNSSSGYPSQGRDSPNTPSSQSGFASPYLLASGLLSPKSEPSRSSTIVSTHSSNLNHSAGGANNNGGNRISSTTSIGNYSVGNSLNQSVINETSSQNESINGSNNGSALTTPVESKDYFDITPKKKKHDKLMAYSNDGSGNHTFFIKQKR